MIGRAILVVHVYVVVSLLNWTQSPVSAFSGASLDILGLANTRRKGQDVTCRDVTCLYSLTKDDQEQKQVQVSAQERILQETLGLAPETEDEKAQRIQQRQTTLNQAKNEKRRNIAVAVLAFFAAILNYGYQFTHPVTSLSLLSEMQGNSADLRVIGKNGKPTVVDFWAPWCENCKVAAPTLAAIEDEYGSKVNFVMVNGDLGENWDIIERFGVDAIPHLAMIGSDGVVETALIGPIPRGVLREDLDTLLKNSEIMIDKDRAGEDTDDQKPLKNEKTELPYKMYDAFRSKPDLRTINFK